MSVCKDLAFRPGEIREGTGLLVTRSPLVQDVLTTPASRAAADLFYTPRNWHVDEVVYHPKEARTSAPLFDWAGPQHITDQKGI